MSAYLSAKFQVSNIILTSFQQGTVVYPPHPSSPPQNEPLRSPLRLQLIRVSKVRFRIFDKLKYEI